MIHRSRAGTLAAADVVDVAKLIQAFFDRKPDVSVPAQRVAFGTSGHRGSRLRHHASTKTTSSPSPRRSAAIARRKGIDGPLFIGRDTHALSEPAFQVGAGSAGGQWRRRR